MFIKRKTRGGKVYAYGMLVSFKTLETYLTSRRTTLFFVKQLLSDITQFFAGDCPMSGANIQA